MATVTAKAGGLVCLSMEQEVFLKLFDSNRFNVQFAKRGAVAAEKSGARYSVAWDNWMTSQSVHRYITSMTRIHNNANAGRLSMMVSTVSSEKQNMSKIPDLTLMRLDLSCRFRFSTFILTISC